VSRASTLSVPRSRRVPGGEIIGEGRNGSLPEFRPGSDSWGREFTGLEGLVHRRPLIPAGVETFLDRMERRPEPSVGGRRNKERRRHREETNNGPGFESLF